MKKRPDGGPAYPVYTPDMNVGEDAGPGMSLRDWFAGQALAGMCTIAGYQSLPWSVVSKKAYGAADAMLAERRRSLTGEET